MVKDGIDPCFEVVEVDRFGDVINRARDHTLSAGITGITGCYQNNGNTGRLWLRFELAAGFNAIHLRHHHIQQNQIRFLRDGNFERLDAGGQRPLVGLLRQVRNQQLLLEQENRNVPLSASPPLTKRLMERVGCKVWVVGDLESGTLNAFKFGWLSCKKTKPLKPRKESR